MKPRIYGTLLAALFASSALSSPLPAQRVAELKHALSVEGRFVRVEDPVHLKIDLWVLTSGVVGSGILNGSELQVLINDKPVGTIAEAKIGPGKVGKKGAQKEAGAGGVPYKAGTQLRIAVPLDLKELLSRQPMAKLPASVHSVKIFVQGLPKTTTEFHAVLGLKNLKVKQLDPAKTRVALVTNYGTMLVSFRPDKAPLTVQNFLKLSLDGFYDGTRFHRVVKDFMIQGGDPNTKNTNPLDDGVGGPGYRIRDEFSDLQHIRGTLSMANLGQPNTGGSQFFVLSVKRPDLDKRYTAFGQLSEGLDALDRISNVSTRPQMNNPQESSSPTTEVVLRHAIVLPVLR